MKEFCPFCGTPVREGHRFCTGCGKSLVRSCPTCGAEAGVSDKFCTECGRAFADDVQPEAGMQLSQDEIDAACVVIRPLLGSGPQGVTVEPGQVNKGRSGIPFVVGIVAGALVALAMFVALFVAFIAPPQSGMQDAQVAESSGAPTEVEEGTADESEAPGKAEGEEAKPVGKDGKDTSSADEGESASSNASSQSAGSSNGALGTSGEGEASSENVQKKRDNQSDNHRYDVVRKDISWSQAVSECEKRGGHLVTIGSREENDAVIELAQDAGIEFVWLGAYVEQSGDGHTTKWITGEPFTFSAWYAGEPSLVDANTGVKEGYVQLWHFKSTDEWSWNDERDDPFANPDNSFQSGSYGYVCEYE